MSTACRKPTAFFRTVAASFGAPLTMLHLMLTTFGGTTLAYGSA